MIAARIVLDARGGISRFEASGHALFAPAGDDIVCSAFSVLARSAYEALAALPGVGVDGEAPGRGQFGFRVTALPSATAERAAGIADFLVVGLSGLARDYPGSVRFTVER